MWSAAAAVGLLACIAFSSPTRAATFTLAELAGGQTFRIGSVEFVDWAFENPTINMNVVTVETIDDVNQPGFQVNGNGELDNEVELEYTFTVRTTDDEILIRGALLEITAYSAAPESEINVRLGGENNFAGLELETFVNDRDGSTVLQDGQGVEPPVASLPLRGKVVLDIAGLDPAEISLDTYTTQFTVSNIENLCSRGVCAENQALQDFCVAFMEVCLPGATTDNDLLKCVEVGAFLCPRPGMPVTIGGTVTGLEGSGLVLQNNGSDDASISQNGDFVFGTPLPPDSSYSVTVASQPTNPEQVCTVAQGSGTVPDEGVDDVLVTCADVPPDPVTIGGTVTGLVGSGLVLQNNGSDDEAISQNGDFVFGTPLPPDSSYSVTVASQPTNPEQVCTVAQGSGTVPDEGVDDVLVTCAEEPSPSGNVGFLPSVYLLLLLGDELNVPPVADFTFTTDGLTADFTDESTDSDGSIVAWSWDFGDGNTSTEQNPSHTYATEGSYDVSLTVTDDQGAFSMPAIESVEVTALPSGDVVRVFITSGVFQGNLGGLIGADQECQAAADAANLGGVWTAWLSDENNDAVDRIPDGEYRLLNGDLVASNKSHLTSTDTNLPLANRILLSELGALPIETNVWTGTQWDGTSIPPSAFGFISNCENWTNSNQNLGCSNGDSDCGNIGQATEVEKEWTLGGSPSGPLLLGCSVGASLYCFGSEAVSE
jgi:PKD repeat protein